MTFAHKLVDTGLWIVATMWVIQFLARGPKPRRRNRKLGPPSPLCERMGQFEVRMGDVSMFKTQAD